MTSPIDQISLHVPVRPSSFRRPPAIGAGTPAIGAGTIAIAAARHFD